MENGVRELIESTNHWGWVGDLYLGQNDCGIAVRLHNGLEYEPESRKLWRSLCAGAELVLDIGAHTGIYSIEAYRAGAKDVLSIEPYHMNYARLVMNLRHAGLKTDSAVYCAAGDENKLDRLTVQTPNYYCSAGGFLGGDPKLKHYPTEVRRVDDLLNADRHGKVKAVKIDTENNGVSVLNGMKHILSFKPDLILECTEPGMGEILKPFGYQFYRINEKTGLERVDDLIPDSPFTFDCPNRFASVNGSV